MKALFLSLVIALAAEAPLDNAEEEARAQALMRELRCVACENEPVSQSAAPIAEDMRARIREMVGEGSTDQEVRDWFESRYGEFVLFRPKGNSLSGALLWIGPFALLGVGGLIGILTARRKRTVAQQIEAEDV